MGIPALLLFIVLGILFNYQKFYDVSFQNYIFAEYVCSFCLIFIMFYGGFGTRWEEAKSIFKEALALSTLGVISTALIITLCCMLVLRINFESAFLIGAVVSSTDAASVFSIIRSKRLSLRYKTSSLLELESGSNDPISYMMTIIAIGLINNTATGMDLLINVILQIVVGLLVGFLIAYGSKIIFRRVKFKDGIDTVFTFSVAILTYALTNLLKGNGYLAVYIVGIYLGNQDIKHKVNLVNFFDGLTYLMQITVFFLLGYLSTPELILKNLGTSFIVFLIITLIARPLSIDMIMRIFRSKKETKLLVSFAGLRGAASIVFAILAHNNVRNLDIDIFHIIFGVVLFSILIQGGLLPFISNRLNMTDPLIDPLKSFSDYQRERPIEFITFKIDNGHSWDNKLIKDLNIGVNILFVLIIRDGIRIIPNGDTKILAGDKVICLARSFLDAEDINIKEILIEEDTPYNGHLIKDINVDNKLIVLIKRCDKYLIPNGNEKLLLNDEVLYIDEDVIQNIE